jgi:hypothetical protein
MNKPLYVKPAISMHQFITFETSISSANCTEICILPDGTKVCVKADGSWDPIP